MTSAIAPEEFACEAAPRPAVRMPARKLRTALGGLMLLCVARLWIAPLGSSFWVDEMGTVFVVRHGAADPSLRAVPQVPASVYYALPRLAERILGSSEIAYRIPSVLAMALALFLIARIASRLIHPQAGWFAAFGCLALHGFNYQAADARPYALGTLVATAAMWSLIRWLDRARWRDAALFALAAALLWRIHLVFWPLYATFALYAVVRLVRADTEVGWGRAGMVFGACGLALIPVLLDALATYRQAGAHVIVAKPSVSDLVNALKLGLVISFCAASSMLNRWRRWPRISSRLSASDTSLILGWWLSAPLGLFFFSWATGSSVFVDRYLFLALPGAALAATAVVAQFLPARQWRSASIALGCGVLALGGSWNHLWPPHHNSDWRGAAGALSRLPGNSAMPVICPSPFIESRPPVWRPDYPAGGFLYSHTAVYRVRGRVYPFPFEPSPEVERYAAALTRDTLAGKARFGIYGGDHNVRWWRDWFAARPELAGWTNHPLGPFGDVEAVVFENDARARSTRASAGTGSE